MSGTTVCTGHTIMNKIQPLFSRAENLVGRSRYLKVVKEN